MITSKPTPCGPGTYLCGGACAACGAQATRTWLHEVPPVSACDQHAVRPLHPGATRLARRGSDMSCETCRAGARCPGCGCEPPVHRFGCLRGGWYLSACRTCGSEAHALVTRMYLAAHRRPPRRARPRITDRSVMQSTGGDSE